MANNLVSFKRGTEAQYQALTTKDADTFYLISDSRKIYLGDTPYGGGIYQTVTSLPDTGVVNTLYFNTASNSLSYWNGTSYVTLSNGDDISSIKERLDTLEGTETTDGSVKKAVKDAQDTLQANIDKKFDTPANKTIAGFGITDAFTKDETNSAISTAVANAHHLKRSIVTELPAVGDANEDTIYMVPQGKNASADQAGSTSSVYNEYMLINGGFELIGTSATDLSDYMKSNDITSAINTAKDGAVSTAASDATTKANTAEQNAKDYADSLAGNYATADQGKKADTAVQAIKGSTYINVITSDANDSTVNAQNPKVNLTGVGDIITHNAREFAAAGALVASDITSGKANGSIAVKGTDVAVTGLGSAAYTDSGAYATKAQGTNADTAVEHLTWSSIA